MSGRSTVPSIVEHDLDLCGATRLHAAPTAEDHVLHRLAPDRQRRLLAHRPQHRVGHVGLTRAFGPTTTLTPEPKSSRVLSGNDLKPFSVSDFRRIAGLSLEFLDGLAGGLLLGVLLAPAAPAASSRPAKRAATV